MTLAEFKAWFDGYTEDMEGPPTGKQWKKVKARVRQIDGNPITRTVFINEYVPRPMRPYWHDPVWYSAPGEIFCSNSSTSIKAFDSQNCMLELGKADAAEEWKI